jgi:hypothetical protein
VVATVPNELKMNCEARYHALVLIWLRFLGFDVHPEVSSTDCNILLSVMKKIISFA